MFPTCSRVSHNRLLYYTPSFRGDGGQICRLLGLLGGDQRWPWKRSLKDFGNESYWSRMTPSPETSVKTSSGLLVGKGSKSSGCNVISLGRSTGTFGDRVRLPRIRRSSPNPKWRSSTYPSTLGVPCSPTSKFNRWLYRRIIEPGVTDGVESSGVSEVRRWGGVRWSRNPGTSFDSFLWCLLWRPLEDMESKCKTEMTRKTRVPIFQTPPIFPSMTNRNALFV